MRNKVLTWLLWLSFLKLSDYSTTTFDRQTNWADWRRSNRQSLDHLRFNYRKTTQFDLQIISYRFFPVFEHTTTGNPRWWMYIPDDHKSGGDILNFCKIFIFRGKTKRKNMKALLSFIWVKDHSWFWKSVYDRWFLWR